MFKEKEESAEDSIGPLKILSPPGESSNLKQNAQTIPDEPAPSDDLDRVRREAKETKMIREDLRTGLVSKQSIKSLPILSAQKIINIFESPATKLMANSNN